MVPSASVAVERSAAGRQPQVDDGDGIGPGQDGRERRPRLRVMDRKHQPADGARPHRAAVQRLGHVLGGIGGVGAEGLEAGH